MRILSFLWKAITYPFVFMHDPDRVLQREFEDEGPIAKDAHLSEYERSQLAKKQNESED